MVRYYTPAYALALLLSAFLLFSVQPMFSKMILPLLGGTPQVWNTAMVFFQACLLAGYAYAHGTSKYLPLKIQAIFHIVLLSAFFFVLPFGIPSGWTPPEETDPTFWQLSLMAVAVGGPFFIVAASAPMLQNWFSQSSHPDKDNPYFLYGASNLGSMSALLAYPTLIEPTFTTGQQAQYWMGGYACLIAFFALCAVLVRNDVHAVPHEQRAEESVSDKITWKQRVVWIVLSAVPSSLVLGVTTHITTDIASVPMLWVLPLALYLLTFIIVFARKPLIKIKYIYALLAAVILPLLILMVGYMGYINPYVMIPFHFSIFFMVALSCHELLARLKPSVLHLTEYFLLMSLGGVIGGIFNSIIAPNIFLMPIEYYLVMALGVAINIFRKELRLLRVCFVVCIKFLVSKKVSIEQVAAIVALLVVTGTTIALYKEKAAQSKEVLIYSDRNFFGYIRVLQTPHTNVLAHGTTVHGVQSRLDEYKGQAISYYNPLSSISDIFKILDEKEGEEQKIAVIGLGVGSMNCYKRDGRFFDFFEIDKEMADVAENEKLFTYLSGCGKREETYDIILGDGRLKIEDKPDGYYDAIFLDAFSSDNIPVHLVTTEAIEIYLKKLKPDGVINFHISNNFLDLEPVLTKNAEVLNVSKLSRASLANVEKDKEDLALAFDTHSLAFTKSDLVLQKLRERGWNETVEREGVRAWTDQYSNIFSVLGNKSVERRLKIASEERKAKEKEENQENANSTEEDPAAEDVP